MGTGGGGVSTMCVMRAIPGVFNGLLCPEESRSPGGVRPWGRRWLGVSLLLLLGWLVPGLAQPTVTISWDARAAMQQPTFTFSEAVAGFFYNFLATGPAELCHGQSFLGVSDSTLPDHLAEEK